VNLDVRDLVKIRAEQPGLVAERAAARRLPTGLTGSTGRLFLVAVDHTARGALRAGDDAMAMGDRFRLLERVATALSRPGVDGVLGTPDIIEDLLLLGALEDKVVIGSMNRGGLAGAAFELDDRMTGYDVAGTVAAGLNGAKMLARIDLADPGTVATREACGAAVTALSRAGRIAMLEPFLANRVAERVVNDLSADAVIKSVHIAQGLGASSAYTWLKLPVVAEMERVMQATTLPTLLLGGDPSGHPEETYTQWEKALALPSVRGLVVGRALLYPRDDDVSAAVDTAVRLVRPGAR
jgi:DhnA family fructose-bisphosphate aldolase class Ia